MRVQSSFLRRLIQLAVFSLVYLPGNAALRAEEKAKPLDIEIKAQGFGAASAADISAVLRSTVSEIWRFCPRTELDGIDIYHRTDHPQTDLKRSPNGRISIGLTARDTRWAQYSFQFAHEFCHTLANFGNNPRQLMRYPPHANFWLEESLCETASLFALRALSRSWRNTPPFPAWRDYAPWFNAYAGERIRLPEHRLEKPFPVWFQENQTALRKDSTIRSWNTIIAIKLLPIFETEPEGWETVIFLNQGSQNASGSLAKHLADWRSRCPEHLRPFIARIAAVFGIRF